jgi:hypothetical protein
MWPYWLMFLVLAFQAVTSVKPRLLTTPNQSWSGAWWTVFVLLTLMIGLRHEVGGDWYAYAFNVEETLNVPLLEAINGYRGDPADNLLNWMGAQSGLGVYLVNSVYASLFTWGLLVFCRKQPRPWLALTVAVPYLITVVAMGYTRQGGAIGLVMLGLVALENRKIVKFLLWIGLAATFHKTAIILVPLAMLAGTKRKLLILFWSGLTGALLYALLLQQYVEALVANYIGAEYQSSGAAIRIAMNALPALVFIFMRNRFHLSPAQTKFWTWMAWGAVAFVAILYISPSSTAVDRVALYWMPFQLFVWSRLPDAIGKPGAANKGWIFAIVGYSAIVYYVWLFFADNSYSWLPYQFYPWVLMWQ